MLSHEFMLRHRFGGLTSEEELKNDVESMDIIMSQYTEREKILNEFVDKIIKPNEHT